MQPFVEIARAKELRPLSALDDVTLTHVLEAACSAVQNYTNRTFVTATYDEMYQGTNSRSLFLNQFPVQSVQAVRYGRQNAIQITNSTQYVQSAAVEATDTALVLTFTNSNTTTPTTLAYATYPTIGQLGAAVNALGNGWSAVVSNAFTSWSSADLAAYKGTKFARTVQAIYAVHYWSLSDYFLNNPNNGELVVNSGWFGSVQAFRIQYTAGFDTIPDEITQATCELAAATYQAGKSDPNLVSESLGNYSYTRAATKSLADLSITARQTLDYYRRPRVPFFVAGGA